METMTATLDYTHAPSQSHRPDPSRAQTATTTRMQQPADTTHQHHHPPHPPTLSQPASQESIASIHSSFGGSSAVSRLQGSDTNLSQLTTDTALTSPSSSADLTHPTATHATPHATQTHNHVQPPRDRTPENAQYTPHLNSAADSALYSPMSITSPVATTNGAKRTASGHVKNAHSITTSPYHTTPRTAGPESRRESQSSSAGSKAGEIAATLRARLGYAMAKVQNGWEHKSLAEVEQLAAERQQKRYEWESVEQQRPGTSGLANDASKLSMYDPYGRSALHTNGPAPSKRTSGNYSQYQAQLQQQQQQQYATVPRLQPAPDIRPTSSQRRAYNGPIFHPPVPQHINTAMSPPRTPVSATLPPQRPATIRTQTQTAEAEAEALQALFQLGSPHTSVGPHIARTGTATTNNSSQGQVSPNRAEFPAPPRHVTFARSESTSTTGSGIDTASAAQTSLQESRSRLVEQPVHQ